MSELYVYPRLPRSHARVLLADLAGVDITGARDLAALSHPAATPVAVGPQKVPDHIIEHVAGSVRELAESLG